MKDYVRFSMMMLLAQEIKERNISGEIAELGVFRGDFAKYLNQAFPDRKLYLFDTFEGFDPRDVDADLAGKYSEKAWFEEMKVFRFNSEGIALSKMKHRDQCVIRKGYFPETIPEEDLTYAFVSLDPDLYQPMLAGLRYFYPRLSEGGYIMIHDYNNGNTKGVRKAVADYERELGEPLRRVPLPDFCGSMILCK